MSRSESPATGRALFFSALAALSLLGGGCAVGGGDKEKASPEPRPELAEKAAPLDPALAPPTTAAAGSGGGTTTTTKATPGGASSPSTTAASAASATTAAPGQAAAPPRIRPLGSVQDPTGDSGIGAPAYNDFVTIAFGETDDGKDLQVIVDVAAAFPAPLGEREVIGIGVDLFRTSPSGSGESDYQLFADGGADGWRAFLQTPDGFVEYPGTFSMGGARLVFQVPWTSVGGRSTFTTASFADWSDGAQTLTRDGQDSAPNLGTRRIDVPSS